MKNIYMLRHGTTTAIDEGTHASRRNIDLSVTGMKEASALVPVLNAYSFDLIIVSPLKRTIDTIQPYLDTLKNKPNIIVEPLTLERELGVFSGTKRSDNLIPEDRKQKGQSKVDWKPEGGESLIEVNERAILFLEKLHTYPEQNILKDRKINSLSASS